MLIFLNSQQNTENMILFFVSHVSAWIEIKKDKKSRSKKTKEERQNGWKVLIRHSRIPEQSIE